MSAPPPAASAASRPCPAHREAGCAPPSAPRPRAARLAYAALAVLCLGLAALGLVLPGLPSTEFVLLAAWAAARGSPRLHAWLWRHRLFGPMLRHWQDGRRVSRRAKYAATGAMAACAAVLAWTVPQRWLVGVAVACMAAVLAWLWRRPEPPP
jgi:uncharacterized membrane protein YbaN (DUF454 family)